MKVLPNPPGDGDVDETRLAAHAEAAVRTPPGTPVSQTPADPNRTTGWSTTSGIDHGRFPPGTIPGDGYRIVGRLGKGGMGDIRWLTVALGCLVGGVTVFVFLRFGLLALATALLVLQVLNIVPLTLDLTAPHAGVSTLALLIVASLAAWAFYISRAGEGMFRRLLSPA